MEPKTVAQKRKGPAAALCTNGCGFFGAAENEGMCSKCYSKRRPAAACQKRKADHSARVFAAVPPPLKKIKLSDPAIGSSSDAAAAGGGAVDTSSSGANAATPAKPATATANRCMTCRKKVGLTGFRCRCGGTFCGSHRHAEAHSCRYDYKAAGREQIAKQNPVVVAAKIAKI